MMSIIIIQMLIMNLGNSNIFEIVQISGGEDAVTVYGRSIHMDTVTVEPIAKPVPWDRFIFFLKEVVDP
jgi:hypothetical protein